MSEIEIKLNLLIANKNHTLSVMNIESLQPIYVLEDAIRKQKIKHKTAIPNGRYEVVLKYSNRFKRQMLFLMNVPNFSGILVHAGNTVNDTSGCLLVGYNVNINDGTIGRSLAAYYDLFREVKKLLYDARVFIVIDR
jgi:hypothetical protein